MENIEKPSKKKGLSFEEQFEKDQKEMDEAVKTFKIDDFTSSPDELRSVVVPKLGKVEYKLLTYDETQALNKEFEEKKIKNEVMIPSLYGITASLKNIESELRNCI